MTTVGDLAAWMEGFAPKRLAEAWDNVGLLLGDPAAPCGRIMTCLTVTPDSAGEAIAERADLIVSHHPILFRAAKTIRADDLATGAVWDLARAGVAVYSPHTAFDNAAEGINAGLARRLGLVEVGPLRPGPERMTFKVVVFCPRADREPVLAAAFEAGAGRIGHYAQCSFSGRGLGTFFGDEATQPAVGQAGRREQVREWRVELLCPGDRLAAVLGAIRARHSYEEPAIDAYPLRAAADGPGIGRLGRLPEPESLGDLAGRVGLLLAAEGLQVVGDVARVIRRVAVACGAGDDLLADALRAGADCLLTGELRFHRALEAEARGLALLVAGHHATERPGVEDLAAALARAFPHLAVWASHREHDPLRSLGALNHQDAKGTKIETEGK